MLKQTLLFAALITTGTIGAVNAQQPDPRSQLDYPLVSTDVEPVDRNLLSSIVSWLSDNFDLPPADLPRVKLVPPARIAAIHYRGFAQTQSIGGNEQAISDAARDIVATYDDATRTIYLPEGWLGETPAELSVLVHEMVHHLQNAAQRKYECPQEREQAAFAAQERWLARHERSLASEFELDPFTLLVRTRCMG
jgi:hypothetical protein